MTGTHQAPVAVIGAGVAGLTAANFLLRHHVPIVLYEAGKQIAGLASSFGDGEGFSYDFGAHFITNRLAAAVGIGAQCKDVQRYGESVLLGGRNYSYPFGLLLHPRFPLSALAARLGALSRRPPPASAAEWFTARFGRALAEEVALPLLEAWSGVPASELAPSVGQKMQGSLGAAHTMFLKLASLATGRAVANGYCRELPESPQVWHVYPQGGVSLLCDRLAEELKPFIRLESPVEAVLVEGGRVVAVKSRGREEPVSGVVSTAPCNVLPKLIGSNGLSYLSRFRFRPMVLVNLRLRGRGLLPDTVLWIPARPFPFFRLTETSRSMPWLAPEGKTIITADIGAQFGDAVWQMPDDILGEFCVDHLEPIIPGVRARYLGCRVLRTPFGYPVYLNEYEADRQRFAESTGIAGLYSIGRNGEFAHILMEDIYWRTLRKMRQLMSELDGSGLAPAASSGK